MGTGATGEPDVDPGLFDFGPDTELPADAPMAALPPWMRKPGPHVPDESAPTGPAAQDDLPAPTPRATATNEERARSTSEQPALPRARRHARAQDEHADQSLAAMLSETEQLAGSLAELPPFDPAADAELPPPARAAADASCFDPAADAELPPPALAAADAPAPPRSDEPVAPVRRRPVDGTAAPAAPRARTKAPQDRRSKGEPAAPRPTREDAPAPADRMRPTRTAVTRAGILAMVVGVVGVGVVGFGALRSAPSTPPVPTGENDAINWITANLGPKASVLAPAAVAQGLGNAHFDTSRVVTYDGGSAIVPDWHCCNVLLAAAPDGQDVQDALPPQLQAAYDSSRPMATFDEDGTTVELRQVLNGTPADVATGIETEHTELVAAGKDIIASKRIELSPAAKAELTAGDVDSRVILALAALSARHLVSVADFPNDAAGIAAGAPARQMVIDALDGKPLATGNAAVTDTTNTFDAAVAPYRPMSLELIDAQAGATSPDMVMTFDAPGPLGLITTKVVTG
ncbi:MAG TPA: hypothetical protein VHV82_21365 [Sporichthyaceae bacterium]|jgi:hypothetical protein|nr:hypothetical protein [Sporichthyaceae bacterium]